MLQRINKNLIAKSLKNEYINSMKKKLYIETSVWNQLEHTDRPEWRESVVELLKAVRKGKYDIYISDYVLEEIYKTPDKIRRQRLLNHIEKARPIVVPFNKDVVELAGRYLESEFMKSKKANVEMDALHVASANINGIKYIVSFNFAHLTNDSKIDGFNVVNLQNNLNNLIDIRPPQIFINYGEE